MYSFLRKGNTNCILASSLLRFNKLNLINKNCNFHNKSFHAIANNQLEPCFRIRSVPMFDDNYGYIVIDEANQNMIAVDPAETSQILPVLLEETEKNGRELLAILTTHKHWDHAGGNEELTKYFPGVTVVGPLTPEIPSVNHYIKDNESIRIGATRIKALYTPCHTQDHIIYVVEGDPDTPPILFSGDTLFVGGCGRFFEGTAEEMYKALYDKILTLPKHTKVYCGHEYTLSNLRFALSLEPTNPAIRDKLKWAKERLSKHLPTIPSTIEEELKYNPFLRVHEKSMQQVLGLTDPIEMIGRIRSLKDRYR